jgi:hypothetical protein
MKQQRTRGSIESILERVFQQLKDWSMIWGYTLLPRTLNIEFMPTEDPDLGRCHFASNTIFLNASLLQSDKESLLLETLCHEASHWMAFRRYGLGIEPHGTEWQSYMREAGFEPREHYGDL